ncbi:MAG: AraC family transcriptional regulator [Puniceicoccaceae bacterium]|nr:MAG: AraC family transcriptional regulator [Puniceicoccaceae bacterium]
MASTPFTLVQAAAEEVRTTSAYFFDNARRDGSDSLVLQRTLGGAGFIAGPDGVRYARVGQVMLFTHREPTVYGYPEGASEPYRLRFLAVTPAPDVRVMFDRLREEFGRVVRMPEGSEAAGAFDAVFMAAAASGFGDRLEEAGAVYHLLLTLYREQVRESRIKDPLEFGFFLLRDQFRRPITLKTIAERCGISREHFIREFGGRYGESPGRMLRRLRLEHARVMLGTTELTVEEVALRSGYMSTNSFCRAFRAVYQSSPGAERARRREVNWGVRESSGVAIPYGGSPPQSS